ncbi:predicted protein [Postia placenta Mad-698-R]|nr:predicted protein [Postia placenta Mad-698-R]
MEGEPSSDASSANTPANRGETPVRTKAVQSASYMEGNLDAARGAVMQDLGTTIPEVSTRFFQTHLLPPLPADINVKQVVNKLRKGKGKGIKGNRCAKFPKDPKNSTECEDGCFKSLEDVATAIEAVTSAMTGKKQLLKFVQNPGDAPESSMRTSKSRPDGCFMLKSQHKRSLRWMDIALSAEYKKVETLATKDDLWQDVRKVIWSMHHCMREDARRRFTYGLTVENRTMRMWFGSRTELLEHHKVVHFFVAMMYAAEHEAGWDPTIQYVWKNDKKNDELVLDEEDNPRLDIDVQDGNGKVVRYRTTKWLSDDGANGLRGRGTRVWEVCILDKGGEGVDRFALKDQWIDHDRLREGMIIHQLRNATTSDATPDATKRIIEQSLLTVEHHGDVYVEGMLDHTRNLMTRNGRPHPYTRFKLQELPENGVKETTTTNPKQRTPAGVGYHQSPEELTTPSVQKIETYHPKVHYRIVFKEVCKPIHEYTSLKEVFAILVHAALALMALHDLGWVHRDTSIGNLLGFILNGVLYCKLSDLEYAKPMDDCLGHEIRTFALLIAVSCEQGTRSFMSVEVYDLKYRFTSSKSLKAKAEEAEPPMTHADCQVAWDLVNASQHGNPETTGKLKTTSSKSTTIRPFRYNALHDIESLWSVVKVDGEPPSMDALQRGSYEVQKWYADLLTTSPHERLAVLKDDLALETEIIHLHVAMRGIANELNKTRAKLVECYYKAEEDLDAIRHTIGHNLLCNIFIKSFITIRDNLRLKDIEIDILRKDPRQEVENPCEIPTAEGWDVATNNNNGTNTGRNSDATDRGSDFEGQAREVGVGDIAEEATAKDGAQNVVVEDPDAGRSVDKTTGPSVPQISTEPLVEGRSTRPQRKRAPPVRYTGTEYNLKKGMTSKTASSSSAPAAASKTATGQSTSGTTSSTKNKAKSKAKSKAKLKTKGIQAKDESVPQAVIDKFYSTGAAPSFHREFDNSRPPSLWCFCCSNAPLGLMLVITSAILYIGCKIGRGSFGRAS